MAKKLPLVLALALIGFLIGFLAGCRPKTTPPPPPPPGPALGMADAFVDSVGVNTHFSYTDSLYYQQFALVKQALIDLKVRHIRDGMHTTPGDLLALLNQLGSAGIGGNYVVDPRLAASAVLAFPSQVNNFESYENNNEADASGGAGWVNPLESSISALKAAADTNHKPAIGPSLINQSWWNSSTNSYTMLGNVSTNITYNNLHNYFGAYHPETKGWGGGCDAAGWCYGSIVWNIEQAQISGPGLGTWTTENGYTINPAKPSSSVPETVYATYLPRMLLAQWNAGILRTYIYELADDPSTACCMGLLDNQGNRRKPYKALQNLLTLLSDKGGAFTPAALDYTIAGAPATLQHTLLAKRDKSYWLALWLGVPSYDPHSYQLINVAPAPITVSWVGKSGGSRLYKFDANGNVADRGRKDGNRNDFNVDDNLTLLKIAM